jgi:hypothetical protein
LPKARARKSRMTMRSVKLTSSFMDGARNTAPSDSARETRIPPTKAPRRLPMPPMMTMLNEATESDRPPAGWNGTMGETSAPAAPTPAAPTPKATA